MYSSIQQRSWPLLQPLYTKEKTTMTSHFHCWDLGSLHCHHQHSVTNHSFGLYYSCSACFGTFKKKNLDDIKSVFNGFQKNINWISIPGWVIVYSSCWPLAHAVLQLHISSLRVSALIVFELCSIFHFPNISQRGNIVDTSCIFEVQKVKMYWTCQPHQNLWL